MSNIGQNIIELDTLFRFCGQEDEIEENIFNETCSNLESTNFFVNIAVCFDLLKVDFYLRVKIYVTIMCRNDELSSTMS